MSKLRLRPVATKLVVKKIAKRIKRTCLECGKKLTIALAKDNTILSGGYYYGTLRIRKEDKAAPESPLTTTEYWVCPKCEEEDKDEEPTCKSTCI